MTTVRRTTVAIAFAASIFGAMGAASLAQAVPIDPINGPGKGCPIEHVDGNGNTTHVTYAKPGDRNGVLVCGADGEWTFGRTAGPNGPGRIDNNGGVAVR